MLFKIVFTIGWPEMLTKRVVCQAQRVSTSYQCLRSFSLPAAARKLPLAYDLYEPAKGVEVKNGPIVFIHGLFGSKKNNRSMSK